MAYNNLLRNNTVDVTLTRGDKGLGFNIKGGVDVPHLPGDPGIFIAKVRDAGAAAEDGRIKEGDKIIEINDVNVQKVTHDEAVKHFMKAGKVVKLKLILGADRIIRENSKAGSSGPTSNGSGSAALGTLLKLLVVVGAGAVIFFGWKRYKQG